MVWRASSRGAEVISEAGGGEEAGAVVWGSEVVAWGSEGALEGRRCKSLSTNLPSSKTKITSPIAKLQFVHNN